MPSQPQDVPAQITAVILSGGKGRRMGGQDKGLVPLAGRPMIAHVLERVSRQANTVIINANRNITEYQQLGVRVVSDHLSDFQGPLAGMACALANSITPFLLVTPCDSPLLPLDLSHRLHNALVEADAEIAVVHDGERLQPVFALLRNRLLPSLENSLRAGERKIENWFNSRHCITVDCSDIADNFININNAEALGKLECHLQLEMSPG